MVKLGKGPGLGVRGLPKFKFKSRGVSKFSRALEDIFPREIQTLGVAGTIMDTMITRSINPDAKCKLFFPAVLTMAMS